MSGCLIALVEWRSCFLPMSRLTVHGVDAVGGKLEEMVAGLLADLVKALVWGQGSEMAKAVVFELATDFKARSCDAHSPWQRPTSKNANGLIREFFRRGRCSPR